MTKSLLRLAVFTILTAGLSTAAFAHAFPERSLPRVGSTIAHSPRLVRIWFDAGLEGLFCHLTVKNAQGVVVSEGRAHVAPHSRDRLLQVKIPTLPAGTYRVYWSVIALDGHHTEGHYPFTVGK